MSASEKGGRLRGNIQGAHSARVCMTRSFILHRRLRVSGGEKGGKLGEGIEGAHSTREKSAWVEVESARVLDFQVACVCVS